MGDRSEELRRMSEELVSEDGDGGRFVFPLPLKPDRDLRDLRDLQDEVIGAEPKA